VENLAALAAFHRAGIIVQAGHILFDHATTWDELEANWRQMRRHVWTVSKGVFTEMYAAAGTPFTRTLGRAGLLAAGPAAVGTVGLGNAAYTVADPAARAVYAGLKRWQRSHARVYDMTIDPLSAPKALEPGERPRFHHLDRPARPGPGRLQTPARRGRRRRGRAAGPRPGRGAHRGDRGFLHPHRRGRVTQAAYDRAGLVYDADDNPFIC
jgi:hypothetical protein